MGLTMALGNALSGMKTGQNSLDVLARNVANAGTPGYHRQSLGVIETFSGGSSYARNGVLSRAFDESLQHHYTRTASDSGFTSVRASFLDRLQGMLGLPGAAGSLDSAYNGFRAALEALGTSPDSYSARAEAVAQAQAMAQTLNKLSGDVQMLRSEAEGRIASSVSDLNQLLGSLEQLNLKLADSRIDLNSRATLLDQRDRMVAEVARMVDVRVDYRSNGTVALMTRSGVGLLDVRASVLEFESVGTLAATSRFSSDASQSGVGSLVLRTSAGVTIDLVQQNVLRSGELAGLIDLRDKTLVEAQAQLDEIAAGLALAMSSVETPGSAIAGGYQIGNFDTILNGNELVVDYAQGGGDKTLRVVHVDDPASLPLASPDGEGNRVIGLDFDAGDFASALQAALGSGFAVALAGPNLSITTTGASEVRGLATRTTAAATQDGTPGLSLFIDNGETLFTNSLDGQGQKLGFAARIGVNRDVLADNALMVQHTPGGSLGDADRPDHLLAQLTSRRFVADGNSSISGARFRIAGTVSDLINQTINYQGSVAGTALNANETQKLAMETISQRLDAEYGVDVDEEMARLMELQNAFAANARVVSVVQELLDKLLQI